MESNIFFREDEVSKAINFLEYLKNIPEPKALVIHSSQGSGKTYFLKLLLEKLKYLKFNFLNGKYLYDYEKNIIPKQKTEVLEFDESVKKASDDAIVAIDDYDHTLTSDYKTANDKEAVYSSILDKTIFANFLETNSMLDGNTNRIFPILTIDSKNLGKIKKHKYASNFYFIKLENHSIPQIKKIIDSFPCSNGNDKYKKSFSDYILANSLVINNFSLKKTIELISARETKFNGKKDLIQNVITILSLNSNYSKKELTNIVTMEFNADQILEDLDNSIILKKQNRTQISNVILMKQLGFSNPNKPVAVVFETGQTGSGKTWLAQVTAKIAYGSENKIIKINMNDFSSGHHVNKLTGSSPGYVGYGEDTFFTKKLKELGSCVILFDEIEKAHHDVRLALLTILDEGMFTDGTGKEHDIRQCIIFLTSNVGAELFSKNNLGKVGFSTDEEISESETKNVVKDEMKKAGFAPEFINRMDYILVFPNLSKEELKKVASINLDKMLKTEFIEYNIIIPDKEEIIEYIIQHVNPHEGARSILRLLTHIKKSIITIIGNSKNRYGKINFTIKNIDPDLYI